MQAGGGRRTVATGSKHSPQGLGVQFLTCVGRGCRQIPAVEQQPHKVAEVLSTHTPALFAAAVRRAAGLLRVGEVVALPTETVYGLAANALDTRAVGRIFEIKGRPAHNPIIVHVASLDLAKHCVADWPALAGKLAKSFWPGPLTLVLPARSRFRTWSPPEATPWAYGGRAIRLSRR